MEKWLATAKHPRYDWIYTGLTYQAIQEPTTMIDTMNQPRTKRPLAALAVVGCISLANISALAAELSGTVQGAKQPIAGSTVTLFAAGTDALLLRVSNSFHPEPDCFNLDFGMPTPPINHENVR